MDAMIFERQVGSYKNKHEMFVRDWVGKEASCYLRN